MPHPSLGAMNVFGKEKPAEEDKKKAKRPDLKAISKMLEANAIMYPTKRIGDLPGIDVGHRFYSRAEMVAVGFHSHWLNGIDYMGQSYKKGVYHKYAFPLAVAIVISGMYEDDLDNAEDVVYTGQGGHDLTGNKRQIRDQKLERGNLALKNCVEQCVPIRVVRGHECASSYCGKVYTYDGLYKVVQYWAEKGLSGFTVFKYRLRRLEGQPILTTNQAITTGLTMNPNMWFVLVLGYRKQMVFAQAFKVPAQIASGVQFSYGRVPQSVAEIRGYKKKSFYHILRSLQIAKNVKLPTNVTGCNCEGSCVDPRTCACAKLNGSDFPYVHCHGGRLIEARAVVFECGPGCGCGPGCVNRTSQRGIKHRLEVFRTPKKGWAVRSWDFIPAGAPVCEYVGVLMRTEDTDHRRLGDVLVPAINNFDGDDQKSESVPEFCIDAGSTGNIARFINHSCEPNLFVQCVLSSHHDVKLARVMLFAADNIPPLQELTYDYGYALDSVSGPDGKIIQMSCYCGAAGCRKRLF
ncbi:unnamed protein product [Dovyalis caffra]|uniref:Histone-lysine N-methyltransferase, H3 lysine-9 specific SUVH4 n=1 Tax=Dovyalis caffra TaxID=77055 RepID=A0AAV1SD94_9ROSI|nr:unnamed protein product [Dovyalis caffra]